LPNDTGLFPRSVRDDVARAALSGLSRTPKTLPAKLFYDEEGCRLFYEITRLPEYYLTRTELGLLKTVASSIRNLADGGSLVEFGGSDETKALILLDQPGAAYSTYVSIDVAQASLEALKGRLAKSHPRLRVSTVVDDFMQSPRLPALPTPRVGFFPGSTIGNLNPQEAQHFMRGARQTLGPNSWFILGADLKKSPDILVPAYNDSKGVTAAFNLNVLRRLNREAGANFDLQQFRHQAIWNAAEERIEMHLFSLTDQEVSIAGQVIAFAEGESIHTENSYKRTRETIAHTARQAGWELQKFWTDPDALFGMFLLGC
jgi:dimethylhistidine N-methyltransferase